MTKLHWNATRLAFVSAVAVLALACSDSPVETTPKIGPLSMTVVSGDDQGALANTELLAPLVVQVVNDRGHAVRDQIVNFRVVSGGGSVFAGTSLTNADGMAREWWTLGASGAQSVEVRAVNPTTGDKQVFAIFTATITPPPPPPPITADPFEPNDTQGSRTIGDLSSGQSLNVLANFHTVTDVDWFRYNVLDGTNSGCTNIFNPSEDFDITTTLANVPPAAIYRVSVFVGGTFAGSRDVAGGTDFTVSYAGSCGSNDGKPVDVQVQRLVGELTATPYSLTVSVIER